MFQGVVFVLIAVVSLFADMSLANSSGVRCIPLFDAQATSEAPEILVKKHNYNSYLPVETTFERRLLAISQSNQFVERRKEGYEPEINYQKILEAAKNDKRGIKAIEAELSFSTEVIDSFSGGLGRLRSIDDDIEAINIHSHNFTLENVVRVKEVVAAAIYYSVLYMNYHGIEYHLSNYSDLMLSTSGSHHFNASAKRAWMKTGLLVAIDPLALLEWGAAGAYFRERKTMHLKPEFLTQEFILQDEIIFHEYAHHLIAELERAHAERPYFGKILVRSTTSAIKKALRVYKKGFSLDELVTFRLSMRAVVHKALTLIWKSKEQINKINEHPFMKAKQKKDAIQQIQNDLNMDLNEIFGTMRFFNKYQTLFARLTRDIFEKRIKTPDDNSGIVMLSKSESYEIGQVTLEQAKNTHELASFVYQMSYLLGESLKDTKDKNLAEKEILLKKINSMISKPEVRRMEGNYPPIEDIIKILSN